VDAAAEIDAVGAVIDLDQPARAWLAPVSSCAARATASASTTAEVRLDEGEQRVPARDPGNLWRPRANHPSVGHQD
jgi:hypothetical protein